MLAQSGNTKGGSITVPLASCLTGLDKSVLQIKTKIVSCPNQSNRRSMVQWYFPLQYSLPQPCIALPCPVKIWLAKNIKSVNFNLTAVCRVLLRLLDPCLVATVQVNCPVELSVTLPIDSVPFGWTVRLSSDEMSLKSFCQEISMSGRISDMQDRSVDDPLSTKSSENFWWNILDLFAQLGFFVSKVTDKKSSWILIYSNTGTSIYTENDGVINTKWN